MLVIFNMMLGANAEPTFITGFRYGMNWPSLVYLGVDGSVFDVDVSIF